jgi:hypothetical protein
VPWFPGTRDPILDQKSHPVVIDSVVYCKPYIYWESSNTGVHYAFISRGRGPPPDLFPLGGGEPPDRHDFFFFKKLKGQSNDEEMVADRETRRPGGEFESTTGSVQGKDHERCKSIFHQTLGCWRITGSGCTKY